MNDEITVKMSRTDLTYLIWACVTSHFEAEDDALTAKDERSKEAAGIRAATFKSLGERMQDIYNEATKGE